MSFAIGIDVGGTFTDLLLMRTDSKEQTINKTATTVEDPSIGVMNGLQNFADELDITLSELLEETKIIVHGTTVTTNAVLTNNGAKTALLTTEGFRDVLQMRRGVRSRKNLFNNKYVAPPALVPRDLRLAVNERIDRNGNILKAVDEKEIQDLAQRIKKESIEAVAISFMHSHTTSKNELETKQILEELLPEVFVTTSAEVVPTIRLYNRTSTVVMNAYSGPILEKYITSLVEKLEASKFKGNLLIMQSNGGVTSAKSIKELPVTTLLSGPAAGPVAGKTFAKESGEENAIVVDMGGTSFEASIIQKGDISVRKEGELNKNSISLPMADIHSIGSGGGSIAYVDDGGLLKVGPQSAGATPGPVCYMKGGTEPTTSDANLILGYLNDDYFLGGEMKLNKTKAKEAISDKIGKIIELEAEEVAYGIFSLSNLNMASGIKEVTVENGYDPREFPMVVAGGAGPIHAAMIAKELGIEKIIIPRFSSVLCAVGMLSSMLRHDYLKSYYKIWEQINPQEIYREVEKEIEEGKSSLLSEGVSEEEQSISLGLDLRYVGQHFEVTVEFDPQLLLEGNKLKIEKMFHNEHNRLYGFSMEGHNIELINIRVSCQGKHTEYSIPGILKSDNGIEKHFKNNREIYEPILKEKMKVPVYEGETMGSGLKFNGPGIVELITTTILVPHGFTFESEESGNFVLYQK